MTIVTAKPTTTRTPKVLPPMRVRTDPDAPALVQAAQVAFRVMAAAKTDTWADALADPTITGRVELTAAQQQALEEGRAILPYLCRRGTVVTVIACPSCGRFVFADKATAPTRCPYTPGCPGRPMGASTVPVRVNAAAQPGRDQV